MPTTTDLDYLRPLLRIYLGDQSAERFLDTELDVALLAGLEALGPWWNFKYLTEDITNLVLRNTSIRFLFPEPPVVEDGDNFPIILMSAIILRTGDLASFSYNLGAWRDAEIAFSNIQGGRAKDSLIARDWDILMDFLKPPQKRLAGSGKKHLQGYRNNPFERGRGLNRKV